METIISVVAIILSIKSLSKIGALKETVQNLSLEVDRLKKNEDSSTKNNTEHEVAILLSEKDSRLDKSTTDTPQDKNTELEKESGFVTWLKEDWLIKLGGVLVFMGVMFFLSIAFAAIGPVGKVLVGYLIGFSLMGFGFKWTQKNLKAGMSINLIGSVVILFTTYIARTPEFNLFNAPLAGILMFGISLYVAFCAYRFKLPYISHVGLVIAGLIPVLTQSSSNDPVQLFTYLLIVVLGTIWLATYTNWRSLILLSQIIVLTYSAIYLHAATTNFEVSILALVFGFVFLVTSIAGILYKKDSTRTIDIFVALLNILYATYWIFEDVPKDFHGISFLGLSLINGVSVYYAYKTTKDTYAFLVYGGASVVLLMTSTAILAHSNVVQTILLLTEVAFATYATHKISNNKDLTVVISLANFYPLVSVMETISSIASGQNSVSNFSITLFACALYSVQVYLLKQNEVVSRIILAISILLGLINIWQILHALLSDGFGTFISLLIYTLLGLAVTWYGYTNKTKEVVKFGRFALGAIALRIIFIDAWSFDNALIGVLICIVMGILLLSTTIISKKYEVKES